LGQNLLRHSQKQDDKEEKKVIDGIEKLASAAEHEN
jgi:hypothetical protein